MAIPHFPSPHKFHDFYVHRHGNPATLTFIPVGFPQVQQDSHDPIGIPVIPTRIPVIHTRIPVIPIGIPMIPIPMQVSIIYATHYE